MRNGIDGLDVRRRIDLQYAIGTGKHIFGYKGWHRGLLTMK